MRKKIFKFATALFLILAGVLIFRPFPLGIQNVFALNQVNNWNFATSTAYYLTTNTGAGTDICGSNTSTAQTAMASIAQSGQRLSAVGGTGSGTTYKAYATQSYTTPSGGPILVKGQFAWSVTVGSVGTTASSTYVRLDVYDSANSTFIANLGCAGALTTITATSTFSSNTYLSGNTTYTLRVTLSTQQKTGTGRSATTVTADNIDVNESPAGISASAPNASTTVSLAWTASTAGAGASALNANGYKIYRSTSATINTSTDNIASPTGTGATYTDNNGSPNTTYYYAVTDIDSLSVESPVSATSTIITNPGKPGTPTFTGVGTNSLTVNWGPPQNGASNYNIWRCTGASCGATPSNFSPVATTSAATYPDSGLAAGTTYDYEIRGLNANNSAGAFSSYGETTTASVSLTFTVDTPSVTFVGGLTPGTPVSTSSVLTVNTNNPTGYNIQINRASTTETLFLTTDPATRIADNPNGNNWTAPATSSAAGPSAVWTTGTTQGLGFRLKLTGTVTNTYSTTWWGTDDTGANAKYSGISTSTAAQYIAKSVWTGSGINEKTTVEYRIDVSGSQKSGAYISSPITYTVLAN